MKFKKLVSVVLVAACVFSLAACGSSSDSTDKSADNGSDSGKNYKIGILQQLEHAALDEATKGFEDACTEKFGEGNVKFDLQNGQGEQANCATIANNFVADNVDLILANATTALQCASAATSDIPILGTSVTDYATALDISDWTGTTGMNISGTSDLAPIDEQEAMLKELLPDAKTVGLLYCSAEPNSAYQAKLFAEALEKDGIAYKEYTAADSNEIQSVVEHVKKIKSIVEKIKYIRKSLNIDMFVSKGKAADDGSSTEQIENMNAFENIAEKFDSLERFIFYLSNLNNTNKNNSKNKVNLTTIHRAKGLEYPVVFIIGCNEGLLPHAKNDSINDEKRLFYVAITRAEKELYISSTDSYNSKDNIPSKFIDVIKPTICVVKKSEYISEDADKE